MSTDDDDADDADHVCGAETETTDQPCQHPVKSPDARCPNHPKDGSGPPEGSGSGDPGHTKGGDPDANIQERLPDNAKPAMDHGFHAVKDDPSGTLLWIEDNDPRGYDWIVSKWDSYLSTAGLTPDDARADDILLACLYDYIVREWTNRQIRDGLTQMETRTTESGGTYETEVELAGNLPADRLARRSAKIKKENNITDDPESKKAEAMGWGQAAKRVAERIDGDVNDDTEIIDE